MISSQSDNPSVPTAVERRWWAGLLAATSINCIFQIAWFWRFRLHNITMDGIAYIGLARHLVDGNCKASVHGYWSPLISWIIAAGTVFTGNFTLLGRLVTVASFVLCLPLLYLISLKLWRSRTAAAFAVFWFSVSRGLISLAVGSILADFVLTCCVLLYFFLLLAALRTNERKNWLLLGVAHALAFLAKAFAMPWLAILSVLALTGRNLRSPRNLFASACLAFLVPAIAWASWGTLLSRKYGVFTTGYQLRGNLMINWNRHLSHRLRGDSTAFSETPSLYDEYMVGETWPSVRTFSLRNPALPGVILRTEVRNLPWAVKELVILLTPAGALAFPVMLGLLIRNRRRYPDEAVFAWISALSVVALIAAYCMLVFDGRYLIPVLPVVITICCPLLLPAELVPSTPHLPVLWQRTGLGLLAVSIVFFAGYWSSPLRTVDRDFEESCYQAANAIRSVGVRGTLVSVGEGPYPEHGVGFEVGPYAAYLSGWRLVGMSAGLPADSAIDELAAKSLSMKATAVLVWGSSKDPAYLHFVRKMRVAPGLTSERTLTDPHKGEVGTAFVFG